MPQPDGPRFRLQTNKRLPGPLQSGRSPPPPGIQVHVPRDHVQPRALRLPELAHTAHASQSEKPQPRLPARVHFVRGILQVPLHGGRAPAGSEDVAERGHLHPEDSAGRAAGPDSQARARRPLPEQGPAEQDIADLRSVAGHRAGELEPSGDVRERGGREPEQHRQQGVLERLVFVQLEFGR